MANDFGRCFTHVIICIAIAAATTTAAVTSTNSSKGFTKCRMSDPAFDKCLANAFEYFIPVLAKGIPSMGILPMDPMRITLLEVSEGNGPVKIKIKFKDMDIFNQQTARLTNLTVDRQNYMFAVGSRTEKPITLKGLYEISGKVLVLPIVGNGTFTMSLDDYSSVTILKMKPKTMNGRTHLHVEHLTWNFVTSKFHMHFNNLFNGDKLLGENMNLFLNENWRDILAEMNPAFTKALSAGYTSIIQQFFNRVPLEEMFLD